ncbi:MAG: hypothetical protein WBL48_05280, partial [Pseudolabrys sp.]
LANCPGCEDEVRPEERADTGSRDVSQLRIKRSSRRSRRLSRVCDAFAAEVNVAVALYWHLADIPLCTAHVRYWG